MMLLSDGLQAVAGDALRDILARFTRTRLVSVVSGTLVTTFVQSSTITTLLTIGFVSAELLTFSSAIGVIYGANIGTTTTAWLVSTIGLKLDIKAFALPMVGIGAMVRMFMRGRRASIGTAIAGFGLLFVGIDVLQTGMSGMADTIDLKQYAADGIVGRMTLVLIGLVITVILQSSGAAMAITLTALFGEAITLDQAASLAIGQAVGTTVTAAVGAIGNTIQAKRTALAHVLFNVVTGVVAFVLLPMFIWGVERFANAPSPGDQAVLLAGFVTGFKVIGVLLFFPATDRFASYITILLPDRGSELTRRLNASSLAVPSIALEAARDTVAELVASLLEISESLLRAEVSHERATSQLGSLRTALDQTRAFLRSVHSDPTNDEQHARHVSVLHAIDHANRLLKACEERDHHARYRTSADVHESGARLATVFGQIVAWQRDPQSEAFRLTELERTALAVAQRRREQRQEILRQAAVGHIDPQETVGVLEAKRWVDRLGYHGWRAVVHLYRDVAAQHSEAPSPDTEIPMAMPDEDRTAR